MKNQIVASIAAVPFAFLSTTTANALGLSGEFQLSSGNTLPVNETSNIFLTEDSIYFEPTPTPVVVDTNDETGGTFSEFNTAYIKEIISFDNFVPQNSFLDFGTTAIAGTVGTIDGLGTLDDSTLTDNLNVFNLTQASYQLNQSGENVAVDVELWGEFVSETGEVTDGAGNLTFQINNSTVEEIQQQLNDGETIGGLTFSGGLFSDTEKVPEPTTLFGLGVVAAGLKLLGRQGNKS